MRKIEVAGTRKRFDGTTDNHYHVRCLRCNRVADVPVEPITGLDKAAHKLVDYDILGHRVEFPGVCSRCRTQRTNRAHRSRSRKEKA